MIWHPTIRPDAISICPKTRFEELFLEREINRSKDKYLL